MNQNESKDFLNYEDSGKPVIPSTLNILTILTIVGCSIGLLWNLATPWFLDFGKRAIEQAEKSGKDMSAKDMEDMAKGKEAILQAEANLVPMIIIGVAGIVLCFLGAIWMRKLKKDGFWIYVAGQIVPYIGILILMGTGAFVGVMNYIMIGITVLFIILYATQRKYLVR